MDGQLERGVVEHIVRWSWTRIATSQDSLRTVNEVLERSRRNIEESMRRLQQSQRLIEDPFYCPWKRSMDRGSSDTGNWGSGEAGGC